MDNSVQKTVFLLDCLEKVHGCRFIWKTTSAVLVEHELPKHYNHHTQSFCRKVKGKGEKYKKLCMRNDMELISRRALTERKPFITTCHAGVAEVVIPVFTEGVYIGTFLCGPFRAAGEHCQYRDAQSEYDLLPLLDPEFAAAMSEVALRVIRDAPIVQEPMDKDNPRLPQIAHINDQRIIDAMTYIKDNFHLRLMAYEVANRVSLSESRFLHLFPEHCQMSFSEYLQRVRIIQAKHLLVGTGLPMSEIADVCGIYDQSRLAVLFKRYFKLSPRTYRKQFRIKLKSPANY